MTVAIIQARMTSNRLPGKVLEVIGGLTMLERVIAAARRTPSISSTIVATTTNDTDDPVCVEAARCGAQVHRGSEHDVLDRYYRAAQAHRAAAVVRLTSDCPFLDSTLIDEVVRRFTGSGHDYASNALVSTYPMGLDVEAMSFAALETAWREAKEPYQRAHVTAYLYQHPERFKLLSIEAPKPRHERWTVDTPEDLAFARGVADALPPDCRAAPGREDIFAVLERQPGLRDLNRDIKQKRLEEG